MKNNKTEILAILDRSGSMSGIHKDLIGGMNSFVEEQKKLTGECTMSVVQFDTIIEDVFWNRPINSIEPFDVKKDFVPRGGTSLLDAMGYGINKLGSRLANMSESERPERILVVAYSDGAENSSHEFTYQKIKEMITHQEQKYSWKFVFMASNIDAAATASQMGIGANSTIQASYSSLGTSNLLSRSLNNYTASYRYANSDEDAKNISFSEEDREAAAQQ